MRQLIEYEYVTKKLGKKECNQVFLNKNTSSGFSLSWRMEKGMCGSSVATDDVSINPWLLNQNNVCFTRGKFKQ